MRPVTTIGGVVLDEAGKPIEGVKVTFSPWGWGPEPGREVLDFDDARAVTDAQGRWVASVVPAGFDLEKLHVAYEHPGYLGQADASNMQPNATARASRASAPR